jgi:tripartite-type tricarboxylate transporter receptor subunit TctC
MKLPRRQFLHLAAGVAALPAMSRIAWAQAYPTRPVRFIVPVAAGGSTDVAARAIGEYLSRSFAQQIYVENRGGAGGIIGIEAAAKSAPDGYTVLVSTDRVASAPHVLRMNVDPIKDLIPVVELSRQPVVLTVHSSLGINSLAELIAYGKQQQKLSYATGGGIGTQQHFVAEWFAKIAGIKVEHVPYRGGGQAINDLIAGHVKVGSLGSTPVIRITKQVHSVCWRNQVRLAQRVSRTYRRISRQASKDWCSINGLVCSSPRGLRQRSASA